MREPTLADVAAALEMAAADLRRISARASKHGVPEPDVTDTGRYRWRSCDVARVVPWRRETIARRARAGEIPGAALIRREVRFDPDVTGPWARTLAQPIVPADQRGEEVSVPFRDLVRAAEERLTR